MPAKKKRSRSKVSSVLMTGLLLAVFLLEQYGVLDRILPPELRRGWSHSDTTSEVQLPPETSDGGILVDHVVDGDTLVLADKTKIRLIGVDTPETKHPTKPVEPFGPEASQFTKRTVEGRQVQVRYDRNKTDRYGRTLGYIYIGEWCLNEELIRAGFSECITQYPFDKGMKARFLNAEAEARRARRGIWSSPDAMRLAGSKSDAAK